MDEFHRNALIRIRDADPALTMDTFVEVHAPYGRMLWLNLSQHGFAVKHADQTLRITEAGRAALGSS